MSRRPLFAVLYAPGITCHEETVYAVEYAGGVGRIVVLKDLLCGTSQLGIYDGLIIPGGFSWGDHLGGGRILAIHLVERMREILKDFLDKQKPILGICNGNQVLVETGILPERTLGTRQLALLQNRSARFECRWSRVKCSASSGWTRGLTGQILLIPVAHGEGRLFYREGTTPVRPVFLYVDAAGEPTEAYPANPSGSPGGIAGITDSTGLVLGMMPHPEHAVFPWHASQDGLKLWRNLVTWGD